MSIGRFILYLFVYFSVVFKVFASETTITPFLGYDSKSGQYSEKCLTGDISRVISDSGSRIDNLVIVDRESFLMSMNTHGEAKVKIPLISGTFKATLDSIVSNTNEKSSYLLKYSISTFKDITSSPTLSSYGKDIINVTLDPGYINARCGSEFVSSVEYGGELVLKITVTIQDKFTLLNFKQTAEASIRILGKKISIRVSLDKEIKNREYKATVEFDGLQIGGDSEKLDELLKTMNSRKWECEIQNGKKDCTIELNGENGAFASFFSYIQNFKKQIIGSRSVYKVYYKNYNETSVNELKSTPFPEMNEKQRQNRKFLYEMKNKILLLLNKIELAQNNDLISRRQKNYILQEEKKLRTIYTEVANNLNLCEAGVDQYYFCKIDFLGRSPVDENHYLKISTPYKNLYFYCSILLKNENQEQVEEVEKLKIDRVVKRFVSISDENSCSRVDDYFYSPLNTTINLSNLDISDISFLVFYPNISDLDLSYNPSISASEIATVLKKNNKLKILSIEGNLFNDEDALSLRPIFSSLISLNASFNRFSNIEIIEEFVKQKKALISLDISSNLFKINQEFLVKVSSLFDLKKEQFSEMNIIYGINHLSIFGNLYRNIGESDIYNYFSTLSSYRDLKSIDFKYQDSEYFCKSIVKFWEKSKNLELVLETSSPDDSLYMKALKYWWYGPGVSVGFQINTCDELIELKNSEPEK